ncbi:metallophosphoesterase [Cryobacterium sp. SO1]|uniref:metallophosphoesterase family protein n=1 Tax=Cryobacterium sp. SO1 TaxID=1897061 RepID=UPI00102314A7|nr:metallophosphoesterase [Cryobacterium sp. SO1]RZI37097.1 3',5'-cyclic adenosine monophosphate phosphodiesterase CpdA [Cryobacterium sp. SO1]
MRERSKFTILHLSDVHATTGELLYGQVDGLARLRQVGEYVVAAGVTPEAVVVTGDLVQRGHSAAYENVDRALRDLGERVGAPVFTVLGNHDSPRHAAGLTGHMQGHYRATTVGDLRLVLLDSSSGSLDPDQLVWLRGVLAVPFGMGTVVALHHAPIPSPLPTLSKIGLRDPRLLAHALRDSDTRLILAGHYHHPMNGLFHGLPVAVGPSLAYHQVMNAGPATVSGHDFAMFSLVQVTADQISTAPVSLQAGHPLFSTTVPPLTSTSHR